MQSLLSFIHEQFDLCLWDQLKLVSFSLPSDTEWVALILTLAILVILCYVWWLFSVISPLGNISSSGPIPVSTKSHSTHEHQVQVSGPGSNVRDSPPQASHRQQQMGANKARRSLDTNFHKRQVRNKSHWFLWLIRLGIVICTRMKQLDLMQWSVQRNSKLFLRTYYSFSTGPRWTNPGPFCKWSPYSPTRWPGYKVNWATWPDKSSQTGSETSIKSCRPPSQISWGTRWS